jgi:anti-anti-sigma regulatory factor
MLVALALRSGAAGGFQTAYTNDLRTFTSYASIVAAMFLSRVLADRALAGAERSAAQAEVARVTAEAQARSNAEQARELAEQNERQRQLLALVATLETPAVTLADGVLLAPLVGTFDEPRAAALTKRLLKAAREQRARLVVIDIAGVPQVDAEMARALLQTAQALRLLGCRVTLTGIAPAVATTLVSMNTALDGVTVARTPQDALAVEQARV